MRQREVFLLEFLSLFSSSHFRDLNDDDDDDDDHDVDDAGEEMYEEGLLAKCYGMSLNVTSDLLEVMI